MSDLRLSGRLAVIRSHKKITLETFDGKLALEIAMPKLGESVVFLNLIHIGTGEIVQKVRSVDFLIRRLWGKTLLRRRGWQ